MFKTLNTITFFLVIFHPKIINHLRKDNVCIIFMAHLYFINHWRKIFNFYQSLVENVEYPNFSF